MFQGIAGQARNDEGMAKCIKKPPSGGFYFLS